MALRGTRADRTILNKIDVHDHGYVRLVSNMGSDLDVVNAARVSYDKEVDEFTDKDAKLIRFLIKNGHTSPFRHCAMTFEIYAPLMVARQWWKYAVASAHIDDQNGWNESSRRYITEEPVFFVPEAFRMAPNNSKQGAGEELPPAISKPLSERLKAFYAYAESLYEDALEMGVAAEEARLFLPAYGMYVRWRWTVSLQGVLHFLNQRLAEDAQSAIRVYANAVYELSSKQYPHTFDEFGVYNV